MTMRMCIAFVIFPYLYTTTVTASDTYDFLHRILMEGEYSEYNRPNITSGTPVMISVELFITDIYSVSEVSMEYEISLFLIQEWFEPRLTFNGSDYIDLRAGSDLMQKVWTPDSYFANQRRGKIHDITMKNAQMRISPNGLIVYDMRLTLTLTCYMRLQRFPIDTQTCSIVFESFGYTSRDVIFKWKPNGASMENILMADFIISKSSISAELRNYTLGTYSRLTCTFVLERKMMYYIMENYLPSTLLVILSWVSFWIGIETTPARASIGITTVLALTTLTSGARANLPRVSYIKAIDIWMFSCSFFVFAALLEFAFVIYLKKWYEVKEQNQKSIQDETNLDPSEQNERVINAETYTSSVTPPTMHRLSPTDDQQKSGLNRNIPVRIDEISRLLFPTAFILFSCVYWFYFMPA
ncbi:glycine receptor subunit alpha-2-like [Glandiceps talaboti]